MRRREPSLRVASLAFAWLIGCGSAPKSDPPPESSPKAHASAAAAVVIADVAPEIAPALPSTPPAPTQPAPNNAPAPAQAQTDIQKALAYDPKDPLADLEAADALDKMAQGGAPTAAAHANAKPPRGSCAVLDEGRRVWSSPGPATIAAVAGAFVVAGYAQREGREQLFVVRVAPGALPEPIVALDVKPPLTHARMAAPGLAVRDENDISVAIVDGAGKLVVRRFRLGRAGHGAAVELATGVDARFAPAIAQFQNRTWVAWTAGTTPMHTQLAVLSSDDAVLSRHDLTPPSMGSAAPTFVSGASPPVLIAVDPRNGVSSLLRVDFGSDGAPQPAQVVVPVSMVSTPTQLAAASSSIGTYVAYAGLGSAATSAVGLVAVAPIAGSASALVKGTAYGQLYLSAAAGPRAVLFAADAPTQPGKDPLHEIHVHVVGMKGPGPATVLRGPGSAARANLARDDSGDVGVVFSADSGIYVARLRCDDGG